MTAPVWEDTPPAVEFVEMDCAVTVCDGYTVGHVCPVTGLNEAGEVVQVELQFCPRHSRVFEALMSGFRGDGGVRKSDPARRHGYTVAVEGLVSS